FCVLCPILPPAKRIERVPAYPERDGEEGHGKIFRSGREIERELCARMLLPDLHDSIACGHVSRWYDVHERGRDRKRRREGFDFCHLFPGRLYLFADSAFVPEAVGIELCIGKDERLRDV